MRSFFLYMFLFLIYVKATPLKHMDNIVLTKVIPIAYDSSTTDCAKKTDINPAFIEQITKSNEPKGKLICFLACAMKKLGLMGADNNINIDLLEPYLRSFKSHLEKYEKLRNGLITCDIKQRLDLPDADECLALHKFSKCLHSLVLWTI